MRSPALASTRWLAAPLVLLAPLLLACEPSASSAAPPAPTPPASASPASAPASDVAAKPEPATPSPPPVAESPAPEANAPREGAAGSIDLANRPWVGDLDGMVERRVIRALVVPSKTFYFVENGRQRGISYEALKAFEDELNGKLGRRHIKVLVVFIPTSYDKLVPALVEGRADVAVAGLTITPARRERVDFTTPTGTGVRELVVTGPRSPALSSLDDLAGQEVFVRKSSSFWEHLEALNRRFAAEGKEPVILKAAPEQLDNEDLLEMLNAGLFGITVVDDFIADFWTRVFPDIHPHPEIAVHTGGETAWMIRQGAPQLKAELDAFIASHRRGTAFGNTVQKRYLGSTTFVKSATSLAEIEKFSRLVALFRQYSDRYDMDHLLMMAQGYQESRLDQQARSSVGAIGVMQVMPATGKDLAVGDIAQVEPNVHAGVKYMRWMIDNYYKNEPMSKLDKALFAFASYNAGAGRLRKLRKEATARGLDPNVWFDNVELVAADRIGAETVTYVSNIFKYSVAYRLVADQEERRRGARQGLTNGGSR
jgi:membrane-bound lytic murein transglycosylase MltF